MMFEIQIQKKKLTLSLRAVSIEGLDDKKIDDFLDDHGHYILTKIISLNDKRTEARQSSSK